MIPTFKITDVEEKAAARRELMQPGGKMHGFFTAIDKILAQSSSKYYLGDDISLADIAVFVAVGQWSGG